MEIDAKGMTPKDVKECMIDGMFTNFKKDGYLRPTAFLFLNGKIIIEQIPYSFFNSREDKQRLASILRYTGRTPEIQCMGLIFEAYGTIQNKDSEMVGLLMSGNLSVSELSTRLDIICMAYSSRKGDELISFIVDPKTKMVKEKFGAGADPEGIFSNLLGRRG